MAADAGESGVSGVNLNVHFYPKEDLHSNQNIEIQDLVKNLGF
jgi:hypothetical protein